MEELMRWPVFQAFGRSKTSMVRAARILCEGYAAIVATFDGSLYVYATTTAKKLRYEKLIRVLRLGTLPEKVVKQIEIGEPIIFLCEDGKLYSDKIDTTVMDKIPIARPDTMERVREYTITEISTGSGHVLALTEQGKVLVWGVNTHGQCGMTDDLEVEPMINPHLDNIVSVSAAWDASACLSNQGEVYVWGTFAHNTNIDKLMTPFKVEQKKGYGSFCQLSLGGGFGMALTNDGRVVSWCRKEYKPVYKGHDKALKPREMVAGETRFVEIAAHEFSSVGAALSFNGVIYTFYRFDDGPIKPFRASVYPSLDSVFILSGAELHVYGKPGTVKQMLAEAGAKPGSYRTIHCVPTAASAMRKAFDNPENHDFKFIVEGKPIYVHKTILTLKSEYFSTMFSGAWKESGQEIEISSFSYNVYCAMLKYFYTEDLYRNTTDSFPELLRLAHQTMNQALVQECVKILPQQLTAENVCTVLSLSETMDLESLATSCRQFAKACLPEVLRSEAFAKLPPKTGHSLMCNLVGNPFSPAKNEEDQRVEDRVEPTTSGLGGTGFDSGASTSMKNTEKIAGTACASLEEGDGEVPDASHSTPSTSSAAAEAPPAGKTSARAKKRRGLEPDNKPSTSNKRQTRGKKPRGK